MIYGLQSNLINEEKYEYNNDMQFTLSLLNENFDLYSKVVLLESGSFIDKVVAIKDKIVHIIRTIMKKISDFLKNAINKIKSRFNKNDGNNKDIIAKNYEFIGLTEKAAKNGLNALDFTRGVVWLAFGIKDDDDAFDRHINTNIVEDLFKSLNIEIEPTVENIKKDIFLLKYSRNLTKEVGKAYINLYLSQSEQLLKSIPSKEKSIEEDLDELIKTAKENDKLTQEEANTVIKTLVDQSKILQKYLTEYMAACNVVYTKSVEVQNLLDKK